MLGHPVLTFTLVIMVTFLKSLPGILHSIAEIIKSLRK